MELLDDKELDRLTAPKAQYASKSLKQERAKQPEKTLVKCVVEIRPWSGDTPLEYWQDYEIDAEDAVSFEEKKWVVILSRGVN